jgi:hypothetical protein
VVIVAAALSVMLLAVLVYRVGPASDGATGSHAKDFVSGAFAKLVVEVDWVVESGTSYKPSTQVIDFLGQRLAERCTKPGGITVSFGNAVPTNDTAFSADELRALESSQRSSHTGGDTAAMWIVFANRYAEGGAGGGVVAGMAYSGSSVAVFAASIGDAATLFAPTEMLEKITVVHEVGHLLGLVDGGTPMVTPHEDPAHPGHSSDPNSVMYWQAEGPGLAQMIQGGATPDNFDSNDIADLRAIGGK